MRLCFVAFTEFRFKCRGVCLWLLVRPPVTFFFFLLLVVFVSLLFLFRPVGGCRSSTPVCDLAVPFGFSPYVVFPAVVDLLVLVLFLVPFLLFCFSVVLYCFCLLVSWPVSFARVWFSGSWYAVPSVLCGDSLSCCSCYRSIPFVSVKLSSYLSFPHISPGFFAFIWRRPS